MGIEKMLNKFFKSSQRNTFKCDASNPKKKDWKKKRIQISKRIKEPWMVAKTLLKQLNIGSI